MAKTLFVRPLSTLSLPSLGGLRGTFINLIFAFYLDHLYCLLNQYQVYRDIQLPTSWTAYIAVLLLAEPWAYRYIIGIEYSRFAERQRLPWPSLGQSKYMATMALFSVVFRSMFKVLLVTQPLLKYLLAPLEAPLAEYPVLLKAPNWIAGVLVVAVEVYFLVSILEPQARKPQLAKELASRWVTSTLLCVWLVFTAILLKDITPSPAQAVGVMSFWFPFLLVFNLFFIPLRFVEFYTDWVDCHTIPQKGLYISSLALVLYRVFEF
jgi:hypothetical protein